MIQKYKPEYILCAAIWYKDLKLQDSGNLRTRGTQPYNIDKGIVICGWRHGNCIAITKAVTGLRTVTIAEDGVGEHGQGFLTSHNRFVDRKEAAIIAYEAGQLVEGTKIENLFSEDLY